MKIKASELTGVALDWAVAKCEEPVGGYKSWVQTDLDKGILHGMRYSTDWLCGGPIIDRERITIRFWDNETHATAYMPLGERDHSPWYHGETALIAAMRCYVATKLGGAVDIPDELGGVR